MALSQGELTLLDWAMPAAAPGALDAAEHPDPVVRAREQQDLDWWLHQARSTLDAGLL